MRGSVAKKGKRWYAVVYDGVDPATGKYRRRWVPAGTRRGGTLFEVGVLEREPTRSRAASNSRE